MRVTFLFVGSVLCGGVYLGSLSLSLCMCVMSVDWHLVVLGSIRGAQLGVAQTVYAFIGDFLMTTKSANHRTIQV